MSKTIIGIMTCLAASFSFAGTTSIIVIAAPGQRNVAIAIIKPADFVACPVSLWSNKKEPAERFADLQLAKARIAQAAGQNPKIKVHSGPVSLSSETRSSLSLSKLSSGYSSASTVQLHILVPVTDGKPGVFAAGLAIRGFVSKVELPNKTKCSLGQIQLGLENPEQYRVEILKRIAEDIKQTRSLLEPAGAMQVTGLENPVVVRQSDDENLDLFINYSLSLTSTAGNEKEVSNKVIPETR